MTSEIYPVLQMPVELPMRELCALKITRPELRAVLGMPHFVETDSYRTFGGEEDWWAFRLPSDQRVVIVLHVPYHLAVFSADPPHLEPMLQAFQIASDDSRLVLNSRPTIIK